MDGDEASDASVRQQGSAGRDFYSAGRDVIINVGGLLPTPPESGGAAPDMPGSGLPRDNSVFTGRKDELAKLEALLESPGGVLAIHAIDGLAGVGKSAFAVHAAHRMAHRFPDGQVFVRLHAHTPGVAPVDPADALADLLLGDGLAPSNLPDGLQRRTRLWRERTARRQMLLILDDAAESAQVLPLLPAAPGTLVLITSRRRLDGLEDVIPFSLGALPRDEAVALIVRTARRPDLDAADPDIAQLAESCGSLPLALSITAARLAAHPDWSAADLATQLTQAEDRLEVLAGRERSVAAALELSYRDLNEAQSRLLRLLGAHPGTSYEPEAAAALLDVDADAARSLLDELEGHRLLDETAPRRYRMHDLVREYAADASRRDHPQESDAALARLLKHYARSQRLDPGGTPTHETALAWLRAEQENLLACIDHAHRAGRHTDALRLSDTIAPLLINEAPLDVAVAVQARARDLAQQIGDRRGEANALTALGQVLWTRGRLAAGQAALTEAENLYRQIGNPSQNYSTTLIQLGHLNRDHAAAQETYAEAMDIAEQAGDQRGQAVALTSLGMRWLETGRYAKARDAYTKALKLYQQIGDRKKQTRTLINLGHAQMGLDQHSEAEATYTKALDLARQFGDWQDEVFALHKIGQLRRMAGDYAAAEVFSREERQVREQAWRSLGIDPLK